MGRLMFVPLLAGVLFLASCGGEEEGLPAQSAGVQAEFAGTDVGGGPEAESAAAGQEQAAAVLGKGDSQLGEGSGNSDVEAVATEESAIEGPDASIPPEPVAQVADGGEQGAVSAEESEKSEDSQTAPQDFVSGGGAGGMEAEGAGELESAGLASEESERIPEDSVVAVSDQAVNWRRLALMLAVAMAIVLVAAGFLVGWILGRRAPVAPTVPGVAPGATDAAAVQGSAARVPTVLVPTAEGLGELKDELVQSVRTFSKAVDERDAKIKRYEEGYDLAVFKRFLRRFIEVDLTLLHALEENPDDENLGNLREFLNDAFEECGVHRFKPDVRSLYREAWGVLGHPKAISTADESLDGRIAKVEEPGYQFAGQTNEPILVRGAKVQIHRFEGKKEED